MITLTLTPEQLALLRATLAAAATALSLDRFDCKGIRVRAPESALAQAAEVRALLHAVLMQTKD